MCELKLTPHRGFSFYVNKATGHAPYFSNMVLYRINRKMATNVVVVGEAGVGKSYMAMDLCRVIEGRTAIGRDRFSVDQVVFTYKQFMNAVLKLKQGKCIVFDEPSYAISHRAWYKQLNQALVQTMESFRFKIHPLFISVINTSLLDRTVRRHLLQFKVVVSQRGKAIIYRIKPSHFKDEVYHNYFCGINILRMFDHELCNRESCLDCSKLMQKHNGKFACEIFRAKYERKKAAIQDKRYAQAKDMAAEIEAKQLTDQQIENLSMVIKDKWLIEGKVDVQALRVALEDAYGVRLSNNKSYKIKRMIELHNPHLLEL